VSERGWPFFYWLDGGASIAHKRLVQRLRDHIDHGVRLADDDRPGESPSRQRDPRTELSPGLCCSPGRSQNHPRGSGPARGRPGQSSGESRQRAATRQPRERAGPSSRKEPDPGVGMQENPSASCGAARTRTRAESSDLGSVAYNAIRPGYNAYQALNEPNPPILPPQLSSCARSPPATHPIAPVTLPSPHGAAGQALP